MNAVTLLAALEFAADKHRSQRRKDAEGSPYVNHLISENPEDRPTLINRSWSDVARYCDDARALGYEGERLKQLVEQWKAKLDQAKGTRDKNGRRPIPRKAEDHEIPLPDRELRD